MSHPHDVILAKVEAAQRRLFIQTWSRTFCLYLFVALLVTTIAVAVIAVVPLPTVLAQFGLPANRISPADWNIGWLAGSLGLAMLAALVQAWFQLPNKLQTATLVDQRFGLRERLSSVVAVEASQSHSNLTDSSRGQAIADALMNDAGRRADKIRVSDHFAWLDNRWAWLPLSMVPIVLAMFLVVRPATVSNIAADDAIDQSEVRQVKAAAAELKKRLIAQRKKATEKGLKESQELFKKMEMQLDKITKSESLNRKDALIQLNELKEQIQQRKDRIGSAEQMRRTLSQMKGLQGGPAEKISKQIQKGDFANAAKEIKKLAEQIKEGKVGEKQKQELAEQVKQLAKQMKDAAKQHEQKKQQLREQIEQAKREGRGQAAADLQKKLNQAEAADSQMQQMQQMAQSMQSAADKMQQGDPQAAADAMQQMADQLGDMQKAMEELEDLQDALDDLAQSKDQMNCQQCNGQGCQACMGNGDGEGPPGMGMGRGSGKGDRPEEETDTNDYDTQVRGNVKRGKAIIAGFADGANRKGVTREQIKSVIDAAINEESDPLEDQVLPRDEREQTRQYFDRLREGI